MHIRPLTYPEHPSQGQTIVLIGSRWHPSSREQLRLLESAGCLAYLVENPDSLQPRWFVNVQEIRVMLSPSATPEMIHAVEERLAIFVRADCQGMLAGLAC